MKYWVHPEWANITTKCGIKVTRAKPTGLVSCGGYLLQQVDYIYAHVQLFYRYGTVYRSYLFNYPKLEPCELVKKQRSFKYSNPLADLIVLGIKRCCPQFNHECPYFPGYYSANDIDINNTIAPLLPPVVPAGQYKIYGRAYLDGNITVAEGEGVGVVKPNEANRGTDFTMLNMG